MAMQTHVFSAIGSDFSCYAMDASDLGLPRHVHDVDHLMIVVSGRVLVETDDKSVERTSDDKPVLFKAGRHHSIKPLVDGTKIINVFEGRK